MPILFKIGGAIHPFAFAKLLDEGFVEAAVLNIDGLVREMRRLGLHDRPLEQLR